MPLVAREIKFQHSYANFHLHIGSNAIRALRGLDLLEPILTKEHLTSGPNQRLFEFLSGTGDELVYDVSFINTTNKIKLNI